jgi:6-phosphofructokinase 2
MSGILTITLNPAIDKSTTINNLIAEKKLKCSTPKFEPGGGGINVARAIKKLGGEAKAMYLAGGYSGTFFTDLLKKENIDVIPVECVDHTRENLIVFDNTTQLQYRFGMPGPKISESEWLSILNKIENSKNLDFIVASGSLPEGIPTNIFKNMATIAKSKKIKFILDTSGDALKGSLTEGLYMIKANLNELSFLAGVDELRINDISEVAKSFIKKGDCIIMVVSLGALGAMLITENESYRFLPPKVKSVSTVGAGDSMVAGILYGLSNGFDIKESVKYGVACGTAATLNPGTDLCHKMDADKIYTQIIEEK